MAQAVTYRDIKYGISEINSGVIGAGTARAGDGTQFGDTSLGSTASTQIPVDGNIDFNKNIQERRPARANGYRQPYYIDSNNDNKGQPVTFTWNSAVTKETIDVLCAGIFQRCVEAGTTPYIKDFQWPVVGSAWALTGATYGYPEFSTDEGYFFGFVKDSPVSTTSEAALSCVPNRLLLTCSSDANDGRLYQSSDWTGRLKTDYTVLTDPTGYTLTNASYYHFEDMKVTITGTEMVCYGMQLEITNGLKHIPAGGTSCTDIAFVTHNVRGYIDVLWDGSARNAFTLAEGDDSSAMPTVIISWGTHADPITTDGDLMFKFSAKINEMPDQGSDERVVRISFQGMKTSGAEDMKVSVANALDRAWQSA